MQIDTKSKAEAAFKQIEFAMYHLCSGDIEIISNLEFQVDQGIVNSRDVLDSVIHNAQVLQTLIDQNLAAKAMLPGTIEVM
jgi:hypothetical protein